MPCKFNDETNGGCQQQDRATVFGLGHCPQNPPHVILRYCETHYGQRSAGGIKCLDCEQSLLWKSGDDADRYVKGLGALAGSKGSSDLAVSRYEGPFLPSKEQVDQPPEEDVQGPSVHVFSTTQVDIQPGKPPPPIDKPKSDDDPETVEARKQAVAKLQDRLKNWPPVTLTGVQTCAKAKPASVIVILLSEDPSKFDSQADNAPLTGQRATVTFAVKGTLNPFVEDAQERGSGKGRTIMVGFGPLQILEEITIDLTGRVAPASEFEETEKALTIKVAPGEQKTVELKFKPKDPRRLHPSFSCKDPEDKLHPLPKDYPIEFLFNPGPGRDDCVAKSTARLDKDGKCIDDADALHGVRMLYMFSQVKPRFPAPTDPKAPRPQLVCATPFVAGSATELVPEGTDPGQAKQRLFFFPKTAWLPASRSWTPPVAQHPAQQDGLAQKYIDISDGKSVGTSDGPVPYVLNAVNGALMNGKRIDHVVVLMLENRGFDHFMGHLYDRNTPPQNWSPPQDALQGPHQGLGDFVGLDFVNANANTYDYSYTYVTSARNWKLQTVKTEHPDRVHGTISPKRGARASNIPRTNPHEDFVHIFQDMYGALIGADTARDGKYTRAFEAMKKKDTRNAKVKGGGGAPYAPYIQAGMDGWAQNFCDGIRHHRGEETTVLDEELISEILDMYLPEQLPVMSGLARHYAVSDLWFCSVPSQTNTNRAYWVSGTAAGLVTNNHYDAYKDSWNPVAWGLRSALSGSHADALPKGTRTLFDVLEDDEIGWKYYWAAPWPPVVHGQACRTAFQQFLPGAFDKNFPKGWDQFEADVKNGTLPPVSYIEPSWGGGTQWDSQARSVGDEFHPVEDMFVGEFQVKKVFDALSKSGLWERTLFVITFDENGGTYDHLQPWAAVPSGREPKDPQFGFEFDCYGVRVPTLLISRYVKPQTIFRSTTATPFDHTSVISTILKWQGIDYTQQGAAYLGERVKGAPTFDTVLEGDGSHEDKRVAEATGLAGFDQVRAAREDAVEYEKKVYLKYVGNQWPYRGNIPAPMYLGDPEVYGSLLGKGGWWYPRATADRAKAMKFKLLAKGGAGKLKAGAPVDVIAAENFQGKAVKDFGLAVPSSPGLNTGYMNSIYLYNGLLSQSGFTIWPLNDRVNDGPIFPGERVLIFLERYLRENLSTLAPKLIGSGLGQYDPYQKLAILDGFASWRAGEWDLWEIESAE